MVAPCVFTGAVVLEFSSLRTETLGLPYQGAVFYASGAGVKLESESIKRSIGYGR